MSRAIKSRYEDPLDRIWLTAAERIGLKIKRTSDAYASTDGRGTLSIADEGSLDPDDCLAQMILHELCHSLVQGPESFEQCDWGLENDGPRDLAREHACLRAQALLLSRHGLREVLAPTTEHRAFYDALSLYPLDDDESSRLARIAIVRSERPPWAPHLSEALDASAGVVRCVQAFAPEGSLFAAAEISDRWHPTHLPVHPDPGRKQCKSCAWRDDKGRCTHAEKRVTDIWEACERYEKSLDCRTCGACCREAYGAVDVSPRDPFVKRHPDLVVREDGRLGVKRSGDRCAALIGDSKYTCNVYDDRPRTCRDLERGGKNCLDARRRVGLSL